MFEKEYSQFESLLLRSCPDLDKISFLSGLERLYQKHKSVNDIHNLTRITSPQEFFEKHIVDSLMIGLVEPAFINSNSSIVDVGCGGGFPCLPLALVNPELRISGIESLGKKVNAVNEIAEYCGFGNLKVHKFRAREASRQKEFNRSFDFVIARAVATVDILIRECRQLLKPGGKMIFYKTPEAIEKELSLAERDTRKHKLSLELSEIFELSESSGNRQFFIIS